MRYLICFTSFLLCASLSGCKSTKTDKIVSEWDDNYNHTRDMKYENESEAHSQMKTYLENILTEYLDYSKLEIEYDTGMPILPHTGKPPVKKETGISLAKAKDEKSNTWQSISSDQKKTGIDARKILSTTGSKGITSTVAEKNMQKESTVFLKWMGGIAISVAILCLFLYILRKFLKKKLHNLL